MGSALKERPKQERLAFDIRETLQGDLSFAKGSGFLNNENDLVSVHMSIRGERDSITCNAPMRKKNLDATLDFLKRYFGLSPEVINQLQDFYKNSRSLTLTFNNIPLRFNTDVHVGGAHSIAELMHPQLKFSETVTIGNEKDPASLIVVVNKEGTKATLSIKF